jgi:hypothetical protein
MVQWFDGSIGGSSNCIELLYGIACAQLVAQVAGGGLLMMSTQPLRADLATISDAIALVVKVIRVLQIVRDD